MKTSHMTSENKNVKKKFAMFRVASFHVHYSADYDVFFHLCRDNQFRCYTLTGDSWHVTVLRRMWED